MRFDEITFFVKEEDGSPRVDVQRMTYHTVVYLGAVKLFFETEQALINFKNNINWAVENVLNPKA